jgi:deoxyribonuclease V
MMACLDVHYTKQLACTAAIVFDDWPSEKPFTEYSLRVKTDDEYKPGRSYLRELPPLLGVIERIQPTFYCPNVL